MSDADKCVVVSGGFDDICSSDIRFLQEAARLGPLHVLLWNDQSLRSATGKAPKFPESERLYFLQAVRFVHAVSLVTESSNADELTSVQSVHPSAWAIRENDYTATKRIYCDGEKLACHVIAEADLAELPEIAEARPRIVVDKKVLVTGCYDWFHSGHVRFFEEVSELGQLYVVVGHDANIKALKGQGHPMFPEEHRRYMVGSIRYVTQALISTGHGWLDAEPELERLKPDIYAVNEDGDKPEKRTYCREHGIEYVVLKRLPKAGLPRRESTKMRGF